ncbi:hypothetical protein BCR34DRAFT_672790 [Clohesyomyces aquaticus]|uniref:EF1G-domain-containing protein n=1 Tax=Clohesyomyces aquaticus TaxID=1231657 RepID=A0A1Y1ZUG6_9PLEO|nr:hypothetical protein BCR34DRAFT_672790 [Clohesyomyces aquaticus]
MSFGKIYSYKGNPRTTPLLAVAKENGLAIEFVPTEPSKGVSPEYLKLNKLGRVPTFQGADGYVLSECIAIAVYLTSQNEKTALLGKTKQDYASILRWMSFANTDVLSALGGWFRPIIGRDPYNKKNVDESQKAALKAVHTFEEHLMTHTYLVGERLTLADIFATGILARGFQYFFDKAWRAENPNVTRWYETVFNQPIFSAVAGKLEFIDEAIKYTPPKKETAKKETAPKKKEEAKPKEEAVEEEEDKPAPKPKHPLEALPRSTFVLDDWKRKYSNEETREVALPWFWENMNFEEFSIWKVDYKYNDELTMTFMTSNLIGGFFARLEASRKYLFGAASVYGETNNSVVQGAFLVRGQEALPAFDVAPDYESYEFTKLDPTKPEDKEFVNDQWSWDKPVTVNGKEYPWADGKGSGGGPSEDNVTGFLVRSTAAKWSKNSVLAVDAGSHLSSIKRILDNHFPEVSALPLPATPTKSSADKAQDVESPSPGTLNITVSTPDSDSAADSPAFSDQVEEPTFTVLDSGPFSGLPFPNKSSRANALHVVREHVSTYLITHPHLDHVSGFVINTAAFHNTSRPKRLAALPFTVNAIKTHLFNNFIWPNLTDEDGGVGLVTFQRLAEGGNIALGEGSGRGYIEICDGLGVKGFKVSHGHCMRGPGHVHRGSNANMPETPGIQHGGHHTSLPVGTDSREGRSHSFSMPSQPGTPGYAGGSSELQRTTSIVQTAGGFEQCVIDSTAYFIRTEATPHTPAREVLIFGDVEPDSVSLSPRNAQVWAEAAPKITAGLLKGIFIECSYNNSQGDAVLYGHLAPRHLIQELQNLAEMVKDARREYEKEKEELRKEKKRKRASNGLLSGFDGADERGGRKSSKTRALGALGMEDETMTDYVGSPTPGGHTGTHTPTNLQSSYAHPSAPTALNLASMSADHSKALLSSAFSAPLAGLKVVIIHVKDTLADGPLVGESILQELQAGESVLAEQGRGLGCVFEVSRNGESYYF